MSNDNVVSMAAPATISDPLTELLRSGARRLIEAAVAAEFEEFLAAFEQEKLTDGRRRVVRNGHLPERQTLTGIGAVDVQVPKTRSRSGAPEPFRSSLVPPYVRRSASVDAAALTVAVPALAAETYRWGEGRPLGPTPSRDRCTPRRRPWHPRPRTGTRHGPSGSAG